MGIDESTSMSRGIVAGGQNIVSLDNNDSEVRVGNVIIPAGSPTHVHGSGNVETTDNKVLTQMNFVDNLISVINEVNEVLREPTPGGEGQFEEEINTPATRPRHEIMAVSESHEPSIEELQRNVKSPTIISEYTRVSDYSKISRKSKSNPNSEPEHAVRMTKAQIKFPKIINKNIRMYMLSRMGTTNSEFDSAYTIPIWSPYQNLKKDKEIQERYCTLGDVGTFNSNGGFEVMFNIFLSEVENRKMHYYPPKNFIPLSIDPVGDLIEKPYINGGYHMSDNFNHREETGNSTYIFESTSEPRHPGGGILVLPKGCSKHSISDRLMNVGSSLRDGYLATYVDTWYEPDNYEDGAPVYEDGSLSLIHTCYQTKVWAAAVLRRKNYRPGQSYAKLTCIDSGAQIYSWEWDRYSMETNIGSSSENVGDIRCTVAVQVLSLHRQRRYFDIPGVSFGRIKDSFASLLHIR